MKKFYFLLVLVLLSSTAVFSQGATVGKLVRHDAKNLSFGFKAGLNMADVADEISRLGNFRYGVVVGAFGTHKISPIFRVSAEILYSQQGSDFGPDLDYLNIPLLLSYNVTKTGFNIYTGVQTGFFLSSNVDFGDKIGSHNTNDLFESIDFAIPFGVSYELYNGLLFDLRLNWGLVGVSSGDAFRVRYGGGSYDYFDYHPPKGKNFVLQLSLGYRL